MCLKTTENSTDLFKPKLTAWVNKKQLCNPKFLPSDVSASSRHKQQQTKRKLASNYILIQEDGYSQMVEKAETTPSAASPPPGTGETEEHLPRPSCWEKEPCSEESERPGRPGPGSGPAPTAPELGSPGAESPPSHLPVTSWCCSVMFSHSMQHHVTCHRPPLGFQPPPPLYWAGAGTGSVITQLYWRCKVQFKFFHYDTLIRSLLCPRRLVPLKDPSRSVFQSVEKVKT